MSRSVYVMEFDPPDSGFTMVPNAMLEDRRLSIEARAALAWMASKPRGFKLSVAKAQEALGIGRDKWQRIARELRAIGALERIAVRDRAGRISVWKHRISWAPWAGTPQAASTSLKTRNLDGGKDRKTRNLDAKSGHQNPENPVNERPENPVPKQYSEKYSLNGDRAREEAPAEAVEPTEAERLEFYAGLINGSRFVPQSLCSPGFAQRLVDTGKVTKERMREVGLL